ATGGHDRCRTLQEGPGPGLGSTARSTTVAVRDPAKDQGWSGSHRTGKSLLDDYLGTHPSLLQPTAYQPMTESRRGPLRRPAWPAGPWMEASRRGPGACRFPAERRRADPFRADLRIPDSWSGVHRADRAVPDEDRRHQRTGAGPASRDGHLPLVT